jgi:hypothetical protein
MTKNINIDTFSCIGSNHKGTPCEDYVYAVDKHIALSDGCSSSPNTDIGARLIVNACLSNTSLLADLSTYTVDLPNNSTVNTFMFNNVKECAKSLTVYPVTALDATLLSLQYIDTDPNNHFIAANVYGDGIIFSKSKSGDIVFYHIENTANMPFYMSYHISKKRLQQYLSETANDKTTVTRYSKQDNGEWESVVISDASAGTPVSIMYSSDELQDLEFIGVASDGLESFVSGNNKMQLSDVIKDVLSIKNTNGNFIRRRLLKMIKNYSKDGFTNYDDVSVGCMYLSDVNEAENDNL